MDGGIALRANRLHGVIVHADDFAGVDDLDRQARCKGMALKFRAHSRFRAYEQHANVVVPRRLDRTFDLRLRPAVRTHRVQSYDARHDCG